jgi:SAM-dependent methyltransferase
MHKTQLDHLTDSKGNRKPQADETQDYGKNPIAVRRTDQYVDEYIQGFVNKWDELIDWKARASSEGTFFIDELKRLGKHKILDVATGTGFHSIRLLDAGFDVVSADGSAEMLAKAFHNGRRRGHVLQTVQADWRWLNRSVHGKFDAVICLGNSFTHLFGSEYFLNMFPLRSSYVEGLMHEVGFQQIRTYADFQETYVQEDPDFFIHIAEKRYPNEIEAEESAQEEENK